MSQYTSESSLLLTDVLVIGGGPAGCWAALNAAEAGARVVLADKGYCGSSGATAASGTQIWYVEPDPAAREAAMASREAMGGYLSDRSWMAAVLDETFSAVNRLADWGYPFPRDENGVQQRISVQGPEYMRLMRRRVKAAGVTILDHAPALQLLVDAAGTVRGASGYRRQEKTGWTVHASAVVIAAGGCAFQSKALGCNVLTGDGYLMAAEAGAELSGMEFSSAYAISPAFSSITKTALYRFARFYYEDGTPIEGAGSARGRSIIARTLLTRPVYARLDLAQTEEMRALLRRAQPNFFLPFDRQEIDPFADFFPVTLRLEGTVRGTGGLNLTGPDCATTVPGLYAAGDSATREPICGGFTGGGSHNAAWAIASGAFSGRAAARYGLEKADRPARVARGAGTAGFTGERAEFNVDAGLAAVQGEVFPLDINYFRTGERLSSALETLDKLWLDLRDSLAETGEALIEIRQLAAMTATARWMYRAALARPETRGMHRREDFPKQNPALRHRLAVQGIDEITVRALPVPELPEAVGQ